jgi:hypothetical protein
VCVLIVLLIGESRWSSAMMHLFGNKTSTASMMPVFGQRSIPDWDFQPVRTRDDSFVLLVYSAWYDKRLPDEVRIVALAMRTKMPAADQIMCVYTRLDVFPNKTAAASISSNLTGNATIAGLVRRIWSVHSYHPYEVVTLTCLYLVRFRFISPTPSGGITENIIIGNSRNALRAHTLAIHGGGVYIQRHNYRQALHVYITLPR